MKYVISYIQLNYKLQLIQLWFTPVFVLKITLFCRELGEVPILLDVFDLVRMKEPDWKCVYTYLTEFYKHIYEKGMT